MTIGYQRGTFSMNNVTIPTGVDDQSVNNFMLLYDITSQSMKKVSVKNFRPTPFWTVVSDQTVTTSVADITLTTGIGSYSEIVVRVNPIAQNALGTVQVTCSQDGGTTPLVANYHDISGTSYATTVQQRQSNIIANQVTNNSSSRCLYFHLWNLTSNFAFQKPFLMWTSQSPTGSGYKGHARGAFEISSTALINWIKISLSGGNIRGDVSNARVIVYGRN